MTLTVLTSKEFANRAGVLARTSAARKACEAATN